MYSYMQQNPIESNKSYINHRCQSDDWREVSQNSLGLSRRHSVLRIPSLESLEDHEISSGWLSDDHEVSRFIAQDFDERDLEERDTKRSNSSFSNRLERFHHLPSRRCSVTESLTDYGETLSRRTSSATQYTHLLPELPLRASLSSKSTTDPAPLRKFSKSSERTLTPPRSTTPSLTLSASTYSPQSLVRPTSVESESSTVVDDVAFGMENRSSFAWQQRHRQGDVEICYFAIAEPEKPLPLRPIKHSQPRRTVIEARESASQFNSISPSRHESYQKPRPAPQTPSVDHFGSHFDWSSDEDGQGLKSRWKKSMPDLRQASRRRGNSNRPTSPGVLLANTVSSVSVADTANNHGTRRTIRVPNLAPIFSRHSIGSSTLNEPGSEVSTYNNSPKPYEQIVAPIASLIERGVSSRASGKLQKQPLFKIKAHGRNRIKVVAGKRGRITWAEIFSCRSRPACRWNLNVKDPHFEGRPYKCRNGTTASAAPECMMRKKAKKEKRVRKSLLTMRRLCTWLARIKLRR